MRSTLFSIAAALLVLAGCDKLTGKKASPGASSSAAASAAPAASATVAAADTSGGAFEGEVEMHISGGGMPSPMTVVYDIKSPNVRFDVSGMPGQPKMWALSKAGESKVYMVMDQQKMIMVMDWAALDKTAGANKTYAIDKTGKTDTVAGRKCEIWNVTESGHPSAELCVAKDVQSIPIGQFGAGASKTYGWGASLQKEGVFPLRAVVHEPNGQDLHMEATRVEKKTLDAALFQLPAGYKQIDTSAFGAGMIPGMPNVPH